MFNGIFSTNGLYHVIGEWNIYCVGPGGTHRNMEKPNKRHKHSLPPGLCGGNLLTTSRCPQRGLSSQSLGKYWQLNQSNQHTSTYSRIQKQTKNPYYVTIHNEYAQENPRINRQGRQITFPGSANPKQIPSSIRPLHTQKQCTARRSSWGLPSLSLTTEGSWIHLGGGLPNLSSAYWRQYPLFQGIHPQAL